MVNVDNVPYGYQDRLGLRFYVDTNFVTDGSRAARQLRWLYEQGWIDLSKTDTVDTELGDRRGKAERDALLGASAGYFESFGPFTPGHSRLDHSVLGNDDDQRLLDRVYRILFPGSDPHDDSTGRTRRKIRDAKHVATAVRYGAVGFITSDGRDLVRKSAEIAAEFDGFRILVPDDALAIVKRFKTRYEMRAAARLNG